MKFALVVPVGLALLVGSARADADRPLLRPTRDVDVTYRITPPANRPGRVLEQRMRWSVAQQLMRIDLQSPRLYVIVDYRTRRMSTVRDADRAVLDMPAPEQMVGMAAASSSGNYVRQGEDQVAGAACTDWRTMASDGRTTDICITSDGVMLRATAGGQTLLTAQSLQYATQAPSVFRVPADYARKVVGGTQ